MEIVNNTRYNLTINSHTVKPGDYYTVGEMTFNSLPIYSDIGSIEVVTEYCKRTFRCYGNLKARESKKYKDNDGRPVILVSDTTPQNRYKGEKV